MDTKKKTISNIGEFGIIDKAAKLFAKQKDPSVIVNLGDDAFCFKAADAKLAVTKDMLIEDVHFLIDYIKPYELGQKSVEVNISDLAAMGDVLPKYIFIGLGLPAKTPISFVDGFVRGIKSACKKYNVLLAGGDTVSASKITISITALGIINGKIVKRDGACIGDLIGITNFSGDSGAGLHFLKTKNPTPSQKYLIKKHLHPCARLFEAGKIAKYISALTDSSDGLDFSIRLLTKNKGAQINADKIPISPQLKKAVCDKTRRLNFALFGGEDYELVFTVPPKNKALLKKLLPQITFIGHVEKTKGIKYVEGSLEKQKTIAVSNSAFNHFKS
jgi:thiamine-monophosphate kinase